MNKQDKKVIGIAAVVLVILISAILLVVVVNNNSAGKFFWYSDTLDKYYFETYNCRTGVAESLLQTYNGERKFLLDDGRTHIGDYVHSDNEGFKGCHLWGKFEEKGAVVMYTHQGWTPTVEFVGVVGNDTYSFTCNGTKKVIVTATYVNGEVHDLGNRYTCEPGYNCKEYTTQTVTRDLMNDQNQFTNFEIEKMNEVYKDIQSKICVKKAPIVDNPVIDNIDIYEVNLWDGVTALKFEDVADYFKNWSWIGWTIFGIVTLIFITLCSLSVYFLIKKRKNFFN